MLMRGLFDASCVQERLCYECCFCQSGPGLLSKSTAAEFGVMAVAAAKLVSIHDLDSTITEFTKLC